MKMNNDDNPEYQPNGGAARLTATDTPGPSCKVCATGLCRTLICSKCGENVDMLTANGLCLSCAVDVTWDETHDKMP
jgi:hypothetical protein